MLYVIERALRIGEKGAKMLTANFLIIFFKNIMDALLNMHSAYCKFVIIFIHYVVERVDNPVDIVTELVAQMSAENLNVKDI